MRIAQQMQQVPINQQQNNQPLNNIKSSQNKTYSLGQRLTAIVLNIMDSLTMIDIEGDVVSAKNISDKSLLPGQQIRVEVTGQEDGNMLLKLIEGDAGKSNGLVAQLTDQLRALGIPFNDKNINMLRTMHEQELNVTSETLAKINQEVASLEQLVKDLSTALEKPINWQETAKTNLFSMQEGVNVVVEDNSAEDEVNQTEMAKSKPTTTTSSENVKSESIKSENIKLENSNQTTSTLEFKNLDAKMKNILLELVNKQHAKLTQTLAFMQKNNIPNTLLNTLLSSELMSGKLNMMSSVLESLTQAKELLPTELNQVVEKMSTMTLQFNEMPDKLNGTVLKEIIESSISLQKLMAENEAKSENGTKAEHLLVSKETQSILVDSPIAWQNFHLPMQLRNEIEDIDIYVKGDKRKGGKFNSDDGLIYIALNTNNLERVKVKLSFKPEKLKIDFICNNESIKNFMSANSAELFSKIDDLSSKTIEIGFLVNSAEPSLSDLEKVDLSKMTVFDVKI